MKRVRTLLVFSLGLMLSACGSSSSHQQVVDGAWNADLSNPDLTSASIFQVVLTQNQGENLGVSGFVFTNPNPCFTTDTTQSATFHQTSKPKEKITGTFTMTVSTILTMENTELTLQGNVNDTTITGTWNLLGGTIPCNKSGTFKMDHIPAI